MSISSSSLDTQLKFGGTASIELEQAERNDGRQEDQGYDEGEKLALKSI